MYMFWMIDRFVLQFKIETNNWRCDRTCKYTGQTEETKIQITAKKEKKEAADSGLRNKIGHVHAETCFIIQSLQWWRNLSCFYSLKFSFHFLRRIFIVKSRKKLSRNLI